MNNNQKENYTGLAKIINDNKVGIICILAFVGLASLFISFTENTWMEGKFFEFFVILTLVLWFIFKMGKK